MLLGSEIRKLLHGYGIHSATIQPEFIEDQLLVDEKQVVHRHDSTPSSSSEQEQEEPQRMTAVTSPINSTMSDTNNHHDNLSSEVRT